MFHATGHTIGIDTIRRIDTTIASDILDRYEKNDNLHTLWNSTLFTRKNFLASCDNIDVLEETTDGKNTFHCTQRRLWQRWLKNERSDEEYTKIGRARTLNPDKMAPIHKLDHEFILKERSNPVFHNDVQITQRKLV